MKYYIKLIIILFFYLRSSFVFSEQENWEEEEQENIDAEDDQENIDAKSIKLKEQAIDSEKEQALKDINSSTNHINSSFHQEPKINNLKEESLGEQKFKDKEQDPKNNLKMFEEHFNNFLGGHPEGVFRAILNCPIFIKADDLAKKISKVKPLDYVHVLEIKEEWAKIGRYRYLKKNCIKSLGLKTLAL